MIAGTTLNGSGPQSGRAARADVQRDMTAARRIMERADELARHSAMEGGIERTYLSPEHAEVDALAAGWMREAGLTTWQDASGARVGRLEGERPGLPALILGSHLDTVPDAGRYDGPLGVLLAIEVARRIAESGRHLPFALETYAFAEEEGVRFGATLLCSRALAGTWTDDLWSLRDADGVSLRRAFTDFGLDPARVGDAARVAAEPGPSADAGPRGVVGYLEAHIEQGPELEAAGRPLGVVTSIAGARRLEITVTGEARHAGGTPYPRRRDALVGASEAVVAIERIGRERDVIATVGRLHVEPGGVNVVPGRAVFSLDLRAETDEKRDAAWEEIAATMKEICTRRGLDLGVEQFHEARSVSCAPPLMDAVASGIRTATGAGAEPMRIWSRAGHDAMAVADMCDIAMMFIRCHDGISHAPDESVLESDVAVALNAYEAAILALAERYEA
ncbi:allantoate amidohydrolase [Acidipropionibacterium virtanenii]|uniref:N-carbamoyl-L-amino acid hydrolase n=1 Tax=Acidipropionibacterium virtanenii TaxID=2057246 RepID=A0A344UX92_9ACTN|nr:allantoate amidohydrolase [Acidipropionibacterium virtanenii]AXE39890.1 N-carbamoyl-L-amino acid hydrolase [Acidipropionibacterium virtanenii]